MTGMLDFGNTQHVKQMAQWQTHVQAWNEQLALCDEHTGSGMDDLTLKCVHEATTVLSAAAAVLMLAPPGGIHTSSPPLQTCRTGLCICSASHRIHTRCTWAWQSLPIVSSHNDNAGKKVNLSNTPPKCASTSETSTWMM